MNQQILDYIKSQRVGVLAVEMPDGSPHAATVHYSNSTDPLVFFFETDRKSRKAESLLTNGVVRASFVIGADESNMKTLQMDGQAKIIGEKDMELFDKSYFEKFTEKRGKYTDQVLFSFTPTWWRFTDWNTPEGKKIWNSEQI